MLDIKYETEFSPSVLREQTMGAGVIPFSKTPDGDICLLLGRERFVPQWKGSCRWSGFEGSRKTDESVEEAARREFDEESLGIVHISSWEHYDARIVLRIVNTNGSQRFHCTYLHSIPWDPCLSKSFLQLRSSLEQVDRLTMEWNHTRPECLRSKEVHSIEELADGRVQVTVIDTDMLISYPWRRLPDGESKGIFEGSKAQQILEWEQIRQRLTRALVPHPSVVVRKSRGFVQDVRIVMDHLEKDQVKWWKLRDLEKVLQHKGHWNNERFRPYFLPVLQITIDFLRSSQATGAEPEPAAPDPSESEAPCGECESPST